MSVNKIPIKGNFPSLKLNRSVRFESTIEADALYFFEYSPDVLEYEEKPFTIEWPLDGNVWRKYTPDYLVVEKHRKLIVECKPSTKLDTDGSKQQFKIGRAWCAQNGHEYHILTDTEIRSGFRLKNIKLLWKYARIDTPHEVFWGLQDYLSDNGHVATIDGICQHLNQVHGQPSASYRQFIYNLLFHHRLQFDIETQMTTQSCVYTCTANYSNGESS